MTESTWNTAEDPNAGSEPFQTEEWSNEVAAETPIAFETLGDGFTAIYLGMDPANNRGIVQAHFDNLVTLTDEYVGSALLTSVGRDLEMKLRKVPEKRQVRIQWTDNLPTGQAQPMRIHKVQWR